MAVTQADLERLQVAISQGVKKLKQGDEEVEYRSMNEMLQAEKRIKRELGLTGARRTAVVRTKSGWR